MGRIRSITLGLALVLAVRPTAARAQAEQGDWSIAPLHRGVARLELDTVQLMLHNELGGMSGSSIALARFRGLTREALIGGAPSSAHFALLGEAGTVSFTGHVGSGRGTGEFGFAPNRAFADTLRQRGMAGPVSDHDLFRLTMAGTTATAVDGLLATLRRYDDERPSATEELVRFATHGVTERVIADLGDAGLRSLTPEGIVRLVNHGVDGSYVRAWRDAGYRDLGADELIRLRSHNVTPTWAQQANEQGGTRLGVERLVRLRRGR
jgi:hypothetical protein